MAAAAAAAAAASRRRPGLSLLLLLLQLHTLLQPVWSQADELKQKMEAHQVIPDVIQTAPSEVLEVSCSSVGDPFDRLSYKSQWIRSRNTGNEFYLNFPLSGCDRR